MKKIDPHDVQRNADRLARFMDEAIRIPGLNIRLGWDSIVGFIPGIGDFIGLLTHAYLIYQGFRLGIRKRVYAKMIGNAMVDFLVGAIPGLGDVFDIFWKSNRRNADLLRREIARHTVGADD